MVISCSLVYETTVFYKIPLSHNLPQNKGRLLTVVGGAGDHQY